MEQKPKTKKKKKKKTSEPTNERKTRRDLCVILCGIHIWYIMYTRALRKILYSNSKRQNELHFLETGRKALVSECVMFCKRVYVCSWYEN